MSKPAGPARVWMPALVVAPALAVLLSGCAAPPPAPEKPPAGESASAEIDAQTAWQQRRTTLAAIAEWNLQGRIAAQAGRKGGNATLLWEMRRGRQTIQLYGPFGGGRIRIAAQPGRAELTDSRGRIIAGANAAEALHKRLGWRVPFAQLRRWVRGLPGAGATGIVVDAGGRVKRFRQGGWRVEYQNYVGVDLGDGSVDLPQRLSIAGQLDSIDAAASPGQKLSVRLVVSRWREIGLGDAGDTDDLSDRAE